MGRAYEQAVLERFKHEQLMMNLLRPLGVTGNKQVFGGTYRSRRYGPHQGRDPADLRKNDPSSMDSLRIGRRSN